MKSTDDANDIKSDIAATLEASSREKGRGKYIFAGLLVLGIVAGYFFLTGLGGRKSGPISYKTEKIGSGGLTVTVTATGTLQPTNEVEVGSELSGTIESVLADYNDQVTVGQILARLDISELESQVKQKQASLASAKAKVLQADATIEETHSKLRNLEKVYKLSRGKVPSQSDMDQAKAAYARALADKESAVANVAEVKAGLEITLTQLSKADIISPVNGVVLTKSIEKGQTVAASFNAPVLFTLAEDLTQMELLVDVDEADIGVVKDGQKARFTVDAYPGRQFDAVIRQVRFNATTTDGVVTYETVLKVANDDLALRPGMTATAEIIVQEASDALLVPSAALRFSPPAPEKEDKNRSLLGTILPDPRRRDRKAKEVVVTGGGNKKIWILKDRHPVPVSVKTGLTDGLHTQILEGDVEPGTEVILSAITTGKSS